MPYKLKSTVLNMLLKVKVPRKSLGHKEKAAAAVITDNEEIDDISTYKPLIGLLKIKFKVVKTNQRSVKLKSY